MGLHKGAVAPGRATSAVVTPAAVAPASVTVQVNALWEAAVDAAGVPGNGVGRHPVADSRVAVSPSAKVNVFAGELTVKARLEA